MRRVKIEIPEIDRNYYQEYQLLDGEIGFFIQYQNEDGCGHVVTTVDIEVNGKVYSHMDTRLITFIDPPEQTMTPRLQLAGMAMQGYLASLRHDCEPVEIKTAIAEHCLQLADAMLAESEKKS